MSLKSYFKNSLRKILNWANQDDYLAEDSPKVRPSLSHRDSDDLGSGINITVFPATGGQVIRTSYYDPIRDRLNSKLYIITDKDDLGVELGQIITRENLSR